MKKGLYGNGATDLKEIFRAPLEAVIQADIDLAEKITDFVLNYGFEMNRANDSEQVPSSIKMVDFSYVAGSGNTMRVSLPVISLISLPYMQIKKARFKMKIKLFNAESDKTKKGAFGSGSGGTQSSAGRLKAFLSPEAGGGEEAMKANMKVSLSMKESDLPSGIIQLLTLMSDITNIKKQERYEQ